MAYNSDLGSSSEVTLSTNHKHYSHRVTHHHNHNHHTHNHSHQMPTVYMPGGHVDMHYLHGNAQPQQPVKPPSSRGSHSSDTSSAYSGSDTMQVRFRPLCLRLNAMTQFLLIILDSLF